MSPHSPDLADPLAAPASTRLPKAQVAADAPPARVTPPRRPSAMPAALRSMTLAPGAAPTALIVDDVAFVRQVMGAALMKDGFVIVEAASVKQALAALEATPVEVVLLDVDLGAAESGYDLLAKIRAEPRLDAMPVILVTGSSCNPDEIARGLLAGATDHMTKPFEPVVLRARVASARRSRAALRAVREHASAVSGESRSIRCELDEAHRVQRASLPQVPLAEGGVLVTGESLPAKKVSGDTFDFVVDAAGRASAILLDAAGHSVASGLVVSACRAALRRALERGKPLDAAISAVQTCLASFGDVLEAAVAVGIVRFSPNENVVEVLNAGLPPIVTTTAAGGIICHPSRSVPLGLLPRSVHPHERIAECSGDVWMLVSDGLTDGALEEDSVRALAVRLGLTRYGAQLAAADPADLRALMLEWVSSNGHAHDDDMTLVLVGRAHVSGVESGR
jgi:DNA-binding response OmpR family regulator